MVFQSILLNFLGRKQHMYIKVYVNIYIIFHYICVFLKWILPDSMYYSFMASKWKGKLLLARILFRNFCIYKFVVFRELWGFVFGVMLPLKKIIKYYSCLYSLIWFKSCGNYYSMIVWNLRSSFTWETVLPGASESVIIWQSSKFFLWLYLFGNQFSQRNPFPNPLSPGFLCSFFFPFLPSLSPFFSYSIFLRIKLLQLISLLYL